MTATQGEWIGAGEAKLLVMVSCKMDDMDAESALMRRAMTAVEVRWSSWVYGFKHSPGIAEQLMATAHERMTVEYTDKYLERLMNPPELTDEEKMFQKAWQINAFRVIAGQIDDSSQILFARWPSGDFEVEVEEDFGMRTISFTGLRFNRRHLLESFGINAPQLVTAENAGIGADRGGRPTNRHWGPAAMLALQLAKLPHAALDAVTHEAAGSMLADCYREMGCSAPSPDNQRKGGGDVLKVVRGNLA